MVAGMCMAHSYLSPSESRDQKSGWPRTRKVYAYSYVSTNVDPTSVRSNNFLKQHHPWWTRQWRELVGDISHSKHNRRSVLFAALSEVAPLSVDREDICALLISTLFHSSPFLPTGDPELLKLLGLMLALALWHLMLLHWFSHAILSISPFYPIVAVKDQRGTANCLTLQGRDVNLGPGA